MMAGYYSLAVCKQRAIRMMGMEEERWAESSEGWAWLLMSSGWELESWSLSLAAYILPRSA